MIKLCSQCKEEKLLIAFSPNSNTKDGLRSKCKPCSAADSMSYYYANTEIAKLRATVWKQNNRDLVNKTNKQWRKSEVGSISELLSQAKKRAKRYGLPFDLTATDIDIPELCPVFGVTLVRGTGKGPTAWSPSLDKIIPAMGYVPGNVRVISQKANVMKSSASPQELLLFAKWIHKTLSNHLTGDIGG